MKREIRRAFPTRPSPSDGASSPLAPPFDPGSKTPAEAPADRPALKEFPLPLDPISKAPLPSGKLSLPERLPQVFHPLAPLAGTIPSPPPAIKLPARPAESSAPPDADSLPTDGDAAAIPGPNGRPLLPEGFRLENERWRRHPPTPLLLGWTQAGIALAALAVGYGLGARGSGPATPVARALPSSIAAPTHSEQQQLDTAFAAMKSAHYADARKLFTVLVQEHPRWTSLNTQIALATLGGHDEAGFEKLIEQSENTGAISSADGRFQLGQGSLGSQRFEDADRYLGESAGADPGRAETYLFWGECLVRWGKPNEAVEKFRAAQLRNPFPTAASVYETKLWLAEVASGLEATDGTAQRIDKALAAEHPTSSALFAAAARAVKAGQFAQAADTLARVRLISEPATFGVMLLDPCFYEERWRPELAGFYPVPAKGSAPVGKKPEAANHS